MLVSAVKNSAVGGRRNMTRSFVSELSQRFLSRDERFSLKWLSPKEAESLWHEVVELLDLYNAGGVRIDPIHAWKNPNARALDNKTVGSWIDNLKCNEHTSLAFQGYRDGGLRSGASVAKRIALCDKVIA